MAPKENAKDRDSARLWVEKYRPRAIADVAHQTHVVSTLQKSVTDSAGRGDLPHLLFYGPPGTGKTSTALALCRDLFGPVLLRSRVLELNASDERGIKVVRDKIKNFAQIAVSASTSGAATAAAGANSGAGGAAKAATDAVVYPCPPFKIIILDEADAITTDAQTALRRTMEAHSKVTRFILICNYISRIIDPLTSRCAKFRFNPLPHQVMLSHLRLIAAAERVSISEDTLTALIDSSDGDLRKAVNTLQSAHRMVKSGSPLRMDDIAAAACLVPDSVVTEFETVTCNKGVTNSTVRKFVDENILNEGYSAQQLISQYSDRLFKQGSEDGVARLNDIQRAAIAIAVAQADKALIDGCDEQLQLYNLASRISTITSRPDDINALRNA